MTSEFPGPRVVPPTNPEGGWGAEHPLVPVPPLGSQAARCDGESPVALRGLVLPGEPEERDRAVRDGLLRFLAAGAGEDAGGLVLDDGPCPACGRVHDLGVWCPCGPRRHFAVLVHGRHALYALSRFPVGLAAAPLGEGPDARRRARREARLAAHPRSVSRGRCSRPRDGLVEYRVRYADVPPGMNAVVSVISELPLARG